MILLFSILLDYLFALITGGFLLFCVYLLLKNVWIAKEQGIKWIAVEDTGMILLWSVITFVFLCLEFSRFGGGSLWISSSVVI